MRDNETDKFLTVAEAVKITGYKGSHIRQCLSDGTVPGHKTPRGRWLSLESDIVKYFGRLDDKGATAKRNALPSAQRDRKPESLAAARAYCRDLRAIAETITRKQLRSAMEAMEYTEISPEDYSTIDKFVAKDDKAKALKLCFTKNLEPGKEQKLLRIIQQLEDRIVSWIEEE